MEFLIKRTSLFDDEIKPCEENMEFKEFTIEFPDGESRLRQGWFIEINNLDELISFNDKYGRIVIYKHWFNESIRVIEIYDTYRE